MTHHKNITFVLQYYMLSTKSCYFVQKLYTSATCGCIATIGPCIGNPDRVVLCSGYVILVTAFDHLCYCFLTLSQLSHSQLDALDPSLEELLKLLLDVHVKGSIWSKFCVGALAERMAGCDREDMSEGH